MRAALRSLWASLFGHPRATHQHRYSDTELLARTEEFNQNADSYWRSIGAQESGRRHVLNRPFSGPTAADDLHRLALMMTELRVGPGLEVLDFGAGSCWLSACLNRMGCRAVAVDISPSALDLGRELFSLDSRQRQDLEPRFLPYDGRVLPLADESVDRIACYDAFHHVPNQDEILREMYRVLRPGGRVVMAEPGEGHSHADSSMFDESVFSVLENDFDILDVEKRARSAGFAGVRIKPYLDPSAEPITAATYVALGQPLSALKPNTLRAGIGVYRALRDSTRTCAIVVLTKGSEVRDSRCPGLLRAEIQLLAPPSPLRGYAGTALQARLRLKNTGDTLWYHKAHPVGGSVLLGCHLLDSSGRPVTMEYIRAPLPSDVLPGAEVEVVAAVPLPLDRGKYTLRFDPVDDNVIWFSQSGSTPLDVSLEVVDPEADPAYWAAITPSSEARLTSLPAGSRTRVDLRVANAGVAQWPHAETLGPGAIRLGAQLLDDAGTPIASDYARADLPRGLAPGEACDVPLAFRLPGTPGRYTLKIDLVQEQVCWFEQRGSRPLLMELEATDELTDSTAPGVLRAELELLQPDGRTVLERRTGDVIGILVRAKNLGNTVWRHADDGRKGHVRLGATLVSAEASRDYWRAPLECDVVPGATTEVMATMPAPMEEGEYTVVLDLVDEGISWFKEEGSAVTSFVVRVARPSG